MTLAKRYNSVKREIRRSRRLARAAGSVRTNVLGAVAIHSTLAA